MKTSEATNGGAFGNATITQEAFEQVYDPIPGDDGVDLRDAIPDDAEPTHVWTVVDGDDGALYACAGEHVVNRVGYVITREPWVSPATVAVFCPVVDAANA